MTHRAKIGWSVGVSVALLVIAAAILSLWPGARKRRASRFSDLHNLQIRLDVYAEQHGVFPQEIADAIDAREMKDVMPERLVYLVAGKKPNGSRKLFYESVPEKYDKGYGWFEFFEIDRAFRDGALYTSPGPREANEEPDDSFVDLHITSKGPRFFFVRLTSNYRIITDSLDITDNGVRIDSHSSLFGRKTSVIVGQPLAVFWREEDKPEEYVAVCDTEPLMRHRGKISSFAVQRQVDGNWALIAYAGDELVSLKELAVIAFCPPFRKKWTQCTGLAVYVVEAQPTVPGPEAGKKVRNDAADGQKRSD